MVKSKKVIEIAGSWKKESRSFNSLIAINQILIYLYFMLSNIIFQSIVYYTIWFEIYYISC